MKNFIIEKDITVLCQQADSFPQGVMSAHETLHSKLPDADKRKFFGISYRIKMGALFTKPLQKHCLMEKLNQQALNLSL